MELSIQNGWLFYGTNRIRLASITSYQHGAGHLKIYSNGKLFRLESSEAGLWLDEYFKCEQHAMRAHDVSKPQTRAASRAKRGEQGEASKATNDSVRVWVE